LAAYGEKEVLEALIMGAVDTLIVSEDINMVRVKIKCNNCDYTEEFNIKKDELPKLEESLKERTCPKCEGALSIEETKDFIEYLSELCEMSGTKLCIVSRETEEGAQISKAFKGLAAILRFKLHS